MNVLVSYRGAQRIRGWETGSMVANAFRRLGHFVDEYGEVYETGESITSSSYDPYKHYDLVLICEHNDGAQQPFNLIGQPCNKRVYWTFDISYKVGHELSVIKNFCPDHIFNANYYLCPVTQDLLGISTTFLPYAADINKHFRNLDEIEKKYDVTLVGTSRPDREKLIEAIRAEGLDARLISGVFKDEYVDALASSRIVINQNPPEGRGLMNMRQFEAPAAGALLLTVQGDGVEQIKLPCMTYLPGQEAKAAKRLVPWSFDLETIRDAGHGYVLTYHTYDNRAKEILATLGM